MAKLNGLKALFGHKLIQERLSQFEKSLNDKMYQTLLRAGEEFLNKARVNGNYQNRTGNLRASIGYIILNNGKILTQSFGGSKKNGTSQGQKVAKEIAQSYTNGFVLIGVAGMNYAAYVEARSYDVISGSAPGSEDLKSILREIKF